MCKPGRRRYDPFGAGLLAGFLINWAAGLALTHPRTALPIVTAITEFLLIVAIVALTISYIRYRRGIRRMTTFLSKDQILGADDRRYEIVEVPEWGGSIRLRSLTGAEITDWQSKNMRGPANKQRINYRSHVVERLIALCAVDEHGAPLFDDPGDVLRLASKSAAAINRLNEACLRLNALTEDDQKEVAEDFENAQNEPSLSG
jgi:hypothetical protein